MLGFHEPQLGAVLPGILVAFAQDDVVEVAGVGLAHALVGKVTSSTLVDDDGGGILATADVEIEDELHVKLLSMLRSSTGRDADSFFVT